MRLFSFMDNTCGFPSFWGVPAYKSTGSSPAFPPTEWRLPPVSRILTHIVMDGRQYLPGECRTRPGSVGFLGTHRLTEAFLLHALTLHQSVRPPGKEAKHNKTPARWLFRSFFALKKVTFRKLKGHYLWGWRRLRMLENSPALRAPGGMCGAVITLYALFLFVSFQRSLVLSLLWENRSLQKAVVEW